MTTHVRRRPKSAGLGFFFATLLFTASAVVAQQTTIEAISGRVASGDGAAVANATVTLRGTSDEVSTRTDAGGTFTFGAVPVGSYSLKVLAAGYDALEDKAIGVASGRNDDVVLTLRRSSSSLVTIGRVQVNGGDALSTSSVPSSTLNADTYAGAGYTRVSDVLQDDISTTLVRPLGGSSILPTSVALRGPDPTETLVDIDGHQVNNGNTGDFDLSLLDPADYSSVELVKGISPSSLIGPDTIDGAINIRTIEPTVNPHGLLRFSGGSFDSFGETLQSTGTFDRLGYVVSLHRTTSNGEVNGTVLDATTGQQAQVGSASDGSSALAKLRYAFGPAADGYVEFSFHDQSQFRDLSAALSSIPSLAGGDGSDAAARSTLHDVDSVVPGTPQMLDSFEGTALQTHNAGYGLDVRIPLGSPDRNGVTATSALLRHYSSLVSESISGPGAQTSSYLYNNHDLVTDDSIEIDHDFAHSRLTFQYGVRNENLNTDFLAGVVNDESVARRVVGTSASSVAFTDDADAAPDPGVSQLALGQTERSAALRYIYEPTSRLHFTAATYYSNYSAFGTSLDPRFGMTYDPDSRSVVRFSVGTTYQSPQLPELYVPSAVPQAVGGYVSVGNPNLKPDRATEYGLGMEHIFDAGPHRTDLSVDFYRVNLRAPASVFLPQLDPNCGAISAGGDGTACPLSYPVNAGDGVYQGMEIAAQRNLAPYTVLKAGYAVRSAYLTNVPASIQDGTLVVGEQALGLPLHKESLGIAGSPPLGFTYSAALLYEGQYNELNRPEFATLNAGVGYRFKVFELSLFATNLTDVYDQRFTAQGAGVPYGGLAGPIATDAYSLQGTALTFTLTHRF